MQRDTLKSIALAIYLNKGGVEEAHSNVQEGPSVLSQSHPVNSSVLGGRQELIKVGKAPASAYEGQFSIYSTENLRRSTHDPRSAHRYLSRASICDGELAGPAWEVERLRRTGRDGKRLIASLSS